MFILIIKLHYDMCVSVDLPSEQRLEALQSAVVLLPDENREVLQSLLFFLYDISTQADDHQMTASNLAVCFAPSLFNMSGTKSVTQSPSPRRPRKNLGVPDARELQEQKAAHECLTTLVQECKKLFNVSTRILYKLSTFKKTVDKNFLMEVPTNYMNSHPLTFDAGIHMS